MRLDTNPGYREGTVPALRAPLAPDLVELGEDLEAVLGQVAAFPVLQAVLAQANPGEVAVFPVSGCTDLLTYR